MATSYVDFYQNMSGSSIWCHVLKGSKAFWLIPPTEVNIGAYKNWIKSAHRSEVFFGDLVEQCCRVTLKEGNTFFIPAGWMHASYSLEDSLAFGGNFLHSFSIERQLRIWKVENETNVRAKHRYPFFVMHLWYVLVRYVHCHLGIDHLSGATSQKKSTNMESKYELITNFFAQLMSIHVRLFVCIEKHQKKIEPTLRVHFVHQDMSTCHDGSSKASRS